MSDRKTLSGGGGIRFVSQRKVCSLRFDALTITLGTRPDRSACATLTLDLPVTLVGLRESD